MISSISSRFFTARSAFNVNVDDNAFESPLECDFLSPCWLPLSLGSERDACKLSLVPCDRFRDEVSRRDPSRFLELLDEIVYFLLASEG